MTENLDLKQKFLEKLESRFPNQLNTSKVFYVRSNIKIILLCKTCDSQFEKTPSQALRAVYACPGCAKTILKKQRETINYKLINEGKLQCSKCRATQSVNNFYKSSLRTLGYESQCKNCSKKRPSCINKREYNTKYYKKNKERLNHNNKIYYYENHRKVLDRYKELRYGTKERRSKTLNRAKKYRESKKEDISYNITKRMSGLIYHCLRNKKESKAWLTLVPYTLEELLVHLKNTLINNITWDNFLNRELHIDHIIPVCAYNISSTNCSDFKKCWDLRNLRLINRIENVSKGGKLYMDLVEKYGIYDLLPDIFQILKV
jgi:hypothetical protein